MLKVGGLVRLLSLFKMKQTCNELILIFITFVPFFHSDLAGNAGKGSLFVGRVQPFRASFFHTLLLSRFLNQRPGSGSALLLQRFIYAPPPFLDLPRSLPLSLCSPFSAYNDGAQEKKNIRCALDTYFMQDQLEESEERKACQFKRSWLGQCSGLQDRDYGYSQGKPCILLRMNRVR